MKNFLIKGFILILFSSLSVCTPLHAEDSLAKMFSKGIEKETEGDCVSAIYIFQDILAENPYFLDAKIALARCLYKTGGLRESEVLLHEALAQERNNVTARNLLGKVLISLKKYEDAEEEYRRALAIEPVNIETRYGLADLYRAKGDYMKAVDIYEDILRVYPQEAWTYIHLGSCYTEMRELEKAGGFFRKAVSLDSLNPWTHINLARHYYQMGVKYSISDPASVNKYLDAAGYESQTALEIEGRLPEAYRILASISFFSSKYETALEHYGELVRTGGETSLRLYEMGFCEEMRGNLEKAAGYYAKALSRRIDDEITRFRLEQVVLQLHASSLSDPGRLELADHHLRKARFYNQRNVVNKAFLQYRRAVQLDPLDPVKRLELSELLRSRGYDEQYLYELRNIIRDTLDVNSVDINDRIEIFENRVSKNLASRWRVDQYGNEEAAPGFVPRTKVTVTVFDGFLTDDIYENYLHRRISKTLSEMLSLSLSFYGKIQIKEFFGEVQSRQEALKRARSMGVDLYITGTVEEREDALKVRLDLLTGVGGKIIRSYDTYFTGNDRVFQTVVALAENVNADIPLEGLIVRMQGDRVLINIGMAHGVQEGMEFHIIREGGLTKNPETGEYVIDHEVSLGTLSVTGVDETVSEGVYTYTGIHNRVNVYDSVVLKQQEVETATAED